MVNNNNHDLRVYGIQQLLAYIKSNNSFIFLMSKIMSFIVTFALYTSLSLAHIYSLHPLPSPINVGLFPFFKQPPFCFSGTKVHTHKSHIWKKICDILSFFPLLSSFSPLCPHWWSLFDFYTLHLFISKSRFHKEKDNCNICLLSLAYFT